MPAIVLIMVDLPAPLSPTRAMTSPLLTWKSTPASAVTAPKRLKTPFSSSRGCPLIALLLRRGGGAAAPPPSVASLPDTCRLAQGRVLPDADVTGLQEAVL